MSRLAIIAALLAALVVAQMSGAFFQIATPDGPIIARIVAVCVPAGEAI